MLPHLAGRTWPCPKAKRQKRMSSSTGGIVPEPPSNTSMETSSHQFRGPTTSNPAVQGTAGPMEHDRVQQGKVLLESGTAPVQKRFWTTSRGWTRFRAALRAIMRIKFSLGHRLRMHNVCTQQSPAQGKGCSLSGCAGGRQLSPSPGAAKGVKWSQGCFLASAPWGQGLDLPLMFHEI